MASVVLLTNADRIADIEKEIRGVKSMYSITQLDLDVMATLKTQKFGSHKQQSILNNIECKVFGRSREYEAKHETQKSA